jgi:glycosyltransferase involved in cell wall biosynthesis
MIRVGKRVPQLLAFLRSSRIWSPRNIVNWHRLVRPMRDVSFGGRRLSFRHLAYDLCTRLAIEYHARPQTKEDLIPTAVGAAPPTGETDGEPRVALFVDSPEHICGVATTLRQWTASAVRSGRSLVIYCVGSPAVFPGSVSFPSVGALRLAAYDGLSLPVPPVQDVIAHTADGRFDVIHVSTPGPMGLAGLHLSQALRLPVSGTYHTDFPRYAARLTADPSIEETAWDYMRWFYGQMDRLAVPSPSTRAELVDHGFDIGRIRLVGRGVNTRAFSPAHRDRSVFMPWPQARTYQLLYVGRVSKEKNLPVLTAAFRRICGARSDVCLVIVGDGPWRETMMRRLHGLPAIFAGMRQGDELSRLYASSDLFVFPSETDTLGVVLLEAQASGLPVLVSSQGGPKDCVLDGKTGLVLDRLTAESLGDTILEMLSDPVRLQRLGTAARQHASRFTPDDSFRAFWEVNRECYAMRTLRTVG